MKQLPDILTSVTFWASVGTLLGAAGAWFTYVAAALDSRRQTYEGVMNLIEGVEAELELVSLWASGGEGEPGYLKSKTQQELIDGYPAWFDPSRMIFAFDTPALGSVTSSSYARLLAPLVRPLVVLNYSIRRVLEFEGYRRTFVARRTDLFQTIVKKMRTAPQNVYTEEEKTYMNFIFQINRQIHQDLIGGGDSTDPGCLYRVFRASRDEVRKFKTTFRREPLPRWYWGLHIVAGTFAISGLWQVLRWFDLWPKCW